MCVCCVDLVVKPPDLSLFLLCLTWIIVDPGKKSVHSDTCFVKQLLLIICCVLMMCVDDVCVLCCHRAAQYACTLLGYTLQKGGAAAELRKTISQLEAHMSLTRKREWNRIVQLLILHLYLKSWGFVVDVCLCLTVLRLGNSVEALEAAKRAIHLSDSVLRLTLTISHLNRAMYFACDNVLWAGKTGLISNLDQKKWSQRSFRWVRVCFNSFYVF